MNAHVIHNGIDRKIPKSRFLLTDEQTASVTLRNNSTSRLEEANGPVPPVPLEPTPLSTAERQQLFDCEAVIAKGLQTFFDVGHALAQIRDARLYRLEFKTFEAYCRERWQYGRRYVDRLIMAANWVKNLSPLGLKMPTSETQVRPLLVLEQEQATLAWKRAQELAATEPLTARHVKTAVAEFKHKPFVSARKDYPETEIKPDDSLVQKLLQLIRNAEYFAKSEHPENTLPILAKIRACILAIAPTDQGDKALIQAK